MSPRLTIVTLSIHPKRHDGSSGTEGLSLLKSFSLYSWVCCQFSNWLHFPHTVGGAVCRLSNLKECQTPWGGATLDLIILSVIQTSVFSLITAPLLLPSR